LATGPAKDFYDVRYLRPAPSGLPGKPITLKACAGERVVLETASGGQPILGNSSRDDGSVWVYRFRPARRRSY
jgi:hypothetical protein